MALEGRGSSGNGLKNKSVHTCDYSQLELLILHFSKMGQSLCYLQAELVVKD